MPECDMPGGESILSTGMQRQGVNTPDARRKQQAGEDMAAGADLVEAEAGLSAQDEQVA